MSDNELRDFVETKLRGWTLYNILDDSLWECFALGDFEGFTIDDFKRLGLV